MTFAFLDEPFQAWQSRLASQLPDCGPSDFVGALASSSIEWLPLRSRLVLRADPTPVAGILGEVSSEDIARFRFAVHAVSETVDRIRILSHRDIEQLTRTLAENLRARLGAGASSARLLHVPRGGAFVQAYLSYIAPEIGRDPDPSRGSVVLLDDAAFSGRRISEQLAAIQASHVIIATLISPPPVRHAVVNGQESRIEWITATNMMTYGETLPGGDELNPPPWSGATEHVVFPWTEPDRGLRLEGTSEFYSGLRIIPPQFCLKNQIQFDLNRNRVHVVGGETAWLTSGAGVLWAEIDGHVHVLSTETQTSLLLEDTAAEFWTTTLRSESFDSALETLSRIFDADAACISSDLTSFLHSLETSGLVSRPA